MTNSTKTASQLDIACEECGAAPGEKCRPYCTAEPSADAAWSVFDRSTYREVGPQVEAADGSRIQRWCLMARKGIGPWVWYLIDRSRVGDDGYPLVVDSGEARTLRKARRAAETAHDTATR